MAHLFRTRAEAIACNADEAARAWRKAAEAKRNGDVKAMRKWDAWARDCDQTATHFANGDYDDVIVNP